MQEHWQFAFCCNLALAAFHLRTSDMTLLSADFDATQCVRLDWTEGHRKCESLRKAFLGCSKFRIVPRRRPDFRGRPLLIDSVIAEAINQAITRKQLHHKRRLRNQLQ